MKKHLSILCLSAGLLLAGCSSATCDGTCAIGSCNSSRCAQKMASRHIVLDTTSNFALNSSQLSQADKSSLSEVVSFLKKNPSEKAKISGYTDITGPAAYNMTLSKKRANAVADYLKQQGISADRITTQGFGATHFIADNVTPTNRAKNRRAEVTFVK